MEVPTTQASEITETFHGVEIRTNNKDIINKDHRVVGNSTISKALEINNIVVISRPPSKGI